MIHCRRTRSFVDRYDGRLSGYSHRNRISNARLRLQTRPHNRCANLLRKCSRGGVTRRRDLDDVRPRAGPIQPSGKGRWCSALAALICHRRVQRRAPAHKEHGCIVHVEFQGTRDRRAGRIAATARARQQRSGENAKKAGSVRRRPSLFVRINRCVRRDRRHRFGFHPRTSGTTPESDG